jgi:hypothetical protein
MRAHDAVLAEPPSTPYAGQQNRIINALSEEEIAELLKGEGMGMARAAELNGYPGPIHVLTLARELKLTPTQRQQIQAIFDRMNAAAKPLGAKLVEHDRVLDQAFADRGLPASARLRRPGRCDAPSSRIAIKARGGLGDAATTPKPFWLRGRSEFPGFRLDGRTPSSEMRHDL